jgi:hypothetical protein
MKTYKLTPLEQLKMEQKRLREERAIAEQRMGFQFQYLADNWGTLLTKGVASSIKNKIAETVDGISSAGNASVAPFITKPSVFNWRGLIKSNLPFLVSSIAWKAAKPALIAFATQKVSSLIFGRRRKLLKK